MKTYYEIEVQINIGEDNQGYTKIYLEVTKTMSEPELDVEIDSYLKNRSFVYGYSKVYGWTPLTKKPEFIDLTI
jgi:hypothetical protein